MKHSLLAKSIVIAISASAITSAFADEKKDIEKITVTGQKIDRTLQETPTSVAVITNKQIEEQNIIGLYDVFDQTPNVTGRFGSSFSIRGINAFNVSGGGNSYLTSVYVDGATLPYRMIQQGGFSAWDLEQVEILRGPQSTLQGRNALAGAIVVSTKKPMYEWDAKVRVTAGEKGQRDLATAFGGELIDNTLAFRFSGEKNQFDGFNYNTTRKEGSDFNENQTYRLKLRYDSASIDGLSAILSYTYNDSEDGVSWVNYRDSGHFDHRITTFNDPTFEKTENKLLTLEVDYDINDYWSITSITTKTDAYYGYEWDGDSSPEPGTTQVDDRDDKSISHESRLIYDNDELRGVIGFYYSDLDVNDLYSGERNMQLVRLGVPQLLVTPVEHGGVGLTQEMADVVLGLYAPIDPVKLNSTGHTTQGVTSSALYTEFTYQINEQWEVYGGFRFDREKQENSSDTQILIGNAADMPDPQNPLFDAATSQLIAALNAQLLQMADSASGTEPLSDADFDAFLPKLGLSYNVNDDIGLHFTYQKGYRSGGVGTNIAQATTHTYEAEYTDNYEFAIRSVWLDGMMTANANFYYLDWEDQQVRVQLSSNTYDTETRNAGSSTVKGFEFESVYQYNDNLRFNFGMGRAITEFKEFEIVLPTGTNDLAGRAFGGAPEWTANLGMTYESDNWFANVNANYSGD